MTDPVPSKERVTDTELRMLIGDMEAWKPSQMSITQKWQLSAFRELQERRAAPEPCDSDELARREQLADRLSWPMPVREDLDAAADIIRSTLPPRDGQ